MRNPIHPMTLIVTAGDHAAQRKKILEELKNKASPNWNAVVTMFVGRHQLK